MHLDLIKVPDQVLCSGSTGENQSKHILANNFKEGLLTCEDIIFVISSVLLKDKCHIIVNNGCSRWLGSVGSVSYIWYDRHIVIVNLNSAKVTVTTRTAYD
jgi:hypothetical protein